MFHQNSVPFLSPLNSSTNLLKLTIFKSNLILIKSVLVILFIDSMVITRYRTYRSNVQPVLGTIFNVMTKNWLYPVLMQNLNYEIPLK